MKRFIFAAAALLTLLSAAYAQVGLPWPGPGTAHSAGGGGIAVVAHTQGAGVTSPSSGAVNMTGATLIVVNVNGYDSTQAPVLSDSQSNTYTRGTCNVQIYLGCLYYVYSPSVSSSMTFTLTGNSIFASFQVVGFSGTVGSSQDQSSNQGNPGTGGTTCQPASSITPGSNNQVVISGAAIATGDGATYTINSGMTIPERTPSLSSNYVGGGIAYIIQTSASAIQPTWTSDQSITGSGTQCSLGSFS